MAKIGLTGVFHRPNRCEAFLRKLSSLTIRDRSDRWCSTVCPVLVSGLEVGVPLRSRVCEVRSWFIGSAALQWLRGLGRFG
jgi:hypothetical protein